MRRGGSEELGLIQVARLGAANVEPARAVDRWPGKVCWNYYLGTFMNYSEIIIQWRSN